MDIEMDPAKVKTAINGIMEKLASYDLTEDEKLEVLLTCVSIINGAVHNE